MLNFRLEYSYYSMDFAEWTHEKFDFKTESEERAKEIAKIKVEEIKKGAKIYTQFGYDLYKLVEQHLRTP